MKRILAGALFVFAFAAIFYHLYSTADARLYAKRLAAERISVGAYENIMSSFSPDGDIITYPGYYAGAYLDEKGKLVILIAASGDDAFKSAKGELTALAGAENKSDITFYRFSHRIICKTWVQGLHRCKIKKLL